MPSSKSPNSGTESPQPSNVSPNLELSPEALAAALGSLSKDELLNLSLEVDALERSLAAQGPKTDDELYNWIKREMGIDIPRTCVCDGHCAPFDFFADAYFERSQSFLVMANRGGSKTFLVALLHFMNSKFKPNCESASVGAIEAQARRAYAHLQKLIALRKEFEAEIASSIMSETRWKNNSRVEVLGGTIAAVNGPHPQKVHFDEVELADPEVFYESRNMAQSAGGIKAQDIITSTRKRGHGMMQRLIDECDEAVVEGHRPPYDRYTWCIFETAANVPQCRMAPENAGKPDEELCECHKIVKGRWDNGNPRLFSDVCRGKLFHSSGWITLDDAHKLFQADSQEVWEAQLECTKPSTQGLVLPRWTPDRYALRSWTIDMANGPIYAGIDFGGTNPHAVVWAQYTHYEIVGRLTNGLEVRVPEGSFVIFDEFYRAEIGNAQLAQEIVAKEMRYAAQVENFKVTYRFPDPQGKAARLDLNSHKPRVPTSFFTTRDVKDHVTKVTELADTDRLWIVGSKCKMWAAEVAAWHFPKKRAALTDDPEVPVSDFDHAMSATRYLIANALWLEKRQSKRGAPPGYTSDRSYGRPPALATAARYVGTQGPRPWREAIRP